MLGLFTLFVSPEDAVAGKTLEHYSSHYSTELGLKNSVRKGSQRFAKTYQATFAPQSWCKKSFSRNSFWKQLAWEAQSPTANSLRLPASAFAYSHGHHGPWWRTKPQTNLKLVHSFSFSSPRTHKNLGLACLPSMPAELCSFQFAEPAPEHQSLKSSTQGED